MQPYIANLQKYCIHDGDGIRTSVFFKGCPLRCVWCHNPETQSFRAQIMTDREKCTGCGACVSACSKGAVRIREGKASTDYARCTGCGDCVKVCIPNIREVAGKRYSISELVKELLKDEMFYEESGGGVTLSGGEVMCADMDYVEAVVRQLNRRGVHVAIDTCGEAPYEHFARILPYVQTFLYDLKMIDQEKHKKYMGVGNERILENLKRLSADGATIYIRIPVIGGVNSDLQSMKETAGWLLEHQIRVAQINLLPYHSTGSSKYGRLELPYHGDIFQIPEEETMRQIAELFVRAGFLHTKIGG